MTPEQMVAKIGEHDQRISGVENNLAASQGMIADHEAQLKNVKNELAPIVKVEQSAAGAFSFLKGKVATFAPPVMSAILGGVLTLGAFITLAQKGCVPNPNPPVVPPVVPVVPVVPPTPPPAPVVQSQLWIDILHDATTDTPAFSALVESTDLRNKLTNAGHKVRIYEKQEDEIKTLRLQTYVDQAGGYPALVLQAGDGKVRAAIKMPSNETDFLAAVKAAGGF